MYDLLMSLNCKDQEVDLGLGIVLAGENAGLRPSTLTHPKTTTPISYPTIKMTSPVSHSLRILLSQVTSMNGLVSIGQLGVNMFFFLGNMYKGISL